MRCDELTDAGDNGSKSLVGIVRKYQRVLSDNCSAKIGDSNGYLRRVDVKRNNKPLKVKLNESWAATTWKMAHRSVQNPLIGDEILDDKRDCTALKAGEPGKIGSGDEWASANQIEEEVSIGLPGSFV